MEPVYHFVTIRVNETSWAHIWRLRSSYRGTGYDRWWSGHRQAELGVATGNNRGGAVGGGRWCSRRSSRIRMTIGGAQDRRDGRKREAERFNQFFGALGFISGGNILLCGISSLCSISTKWIKNGIEPLGSTILLNQTPP
jgi:hypothetical protein